MRWKFPVEPGGPNSREYRRWRVGPAYYNSGGGLDFAQEAPCARACLVGEVAGYIERYFDVIASSVANTAGRRS